MSEKFSLKDHLFNPQKVEYLSNLIKTAYPEFKKEEFIKRIIDKFPELELKERIVWIRENIKIFLPKEYSKALEILLLSLPPECDPTKTDDDFGDFILAPFSDFVAYYGCTDKYLKISLDALKEMTKRFSAEDSIRYFINTFPEETLQEIYKWSKDENYHVRRLASEGTRPSLPWSQKVTLDSKEIIINILDNLYTDPTRYVVRSVANHINDISKKDPKLVILTLTRWRKENRENRNPNKTQDEKELEYCISHSLRTLIKKGNPEGLELLGYSPNPKIQISQFTISTPTVHIGDSLKFSLTIIAEEKQNLMIDYIIYFQGKNEKLLPKVFKLKKISVEKDEIITLEKKHPLRIMTTKKLYSGIHKISLQINGTEYEEESFRLI